MWVSRALVIRPACIIRLHEQNLWQRPAPRSKSQTLASSLGAAATSLLLSALLGCRLRCNTELSTWTDPFSEDLVPRCVKLHPSASLHVPALAEKQRRVEHVSIQAGKELLAPGIGGSTELFRVQVDPVSSFGFPTEVQSRLADLILTEEGSRGTVLLDLTCI